MTQTVILKGHGIQKEALAGAAAITPGDLLTRNSSGAFIQHNAAGSPTAALFAKENEVIGAGIDTAYANGDNVIAVHTYSGMEVYAFVAAAAAAIVIGDLLESAGDGTLRKITDAADLTEGAGAIGGTQDGDPPDLVDPSGDSGASLIDGVRETAAKLNALTPNVSRVGAIARALEAVNNSGGGTEARIKVEIL